MVKAKESESMESNRPSLIETIGKIAGGIILVAITILYFIRFEGPGAQQWFAEHPVIHFFYNLFHFFG